MRAALADQEVAAAMSPLGAHYWDVEDNSPPGGGDERPTGDDWKSPFDDPSNLFGQLGWGSTWFSDRYLWEWQHVYELSFLANGCSGTPDDWIVSWNADHASSPSKPAIEVCGLDANQATLTVIKDSVPGDPWDKYDFLVSGPTPQGFRLQDPGVNECPENPLCSSAENTGAWTHPDRVTSTGLIASPDLGGATYRVEELAPDSGYTVGWECKNVAHPRLGQGGWRRRPRRPAIRRARRSTSTPARRSPRTAPPRARTGPMATSPAGRPIPTSPLALPTE